MFERIKELFVKHPYLMSGGLIVVFIIFYYAFSRGSSGTTFTTGGASGTDAQTAAISAQENIAQLQAQTALSAKQIDASVASQQISAAVDTTKYQTDAQLAALQSNNATQVQMAQIQAGSNEAQVKALEDIVTAQYGAQEHATDAAYGYLNTLANIQGAVLIQNHQADVNLVNNNLSGIKNSQLRAGLIESVTGNPSAGVASQNGVTANTVSGQNQVTQIISAALAAL